MVAFFKHLQVQSVLSNILVSQIFWEKSVFSFFFVLLANLKSDCKSQYCPNTLPSGKNRSIILIWFWGGVSIQMKHAVNVFVGLYNYCYSNIKDQFVTYQLFLWRNRRCDLLVKKPPSASKWYRQRGRATNTGENKLHTSFPANTFLCKPQIFTQR